MKGPDLIALLEEEGFVISRRSKSFVWLARGGDQLMIEADGEIEEEIAHDILRRARRKPG